MNRGELIGALSKMDRGPGKRYPRELREALISWVQAERERGCSWAEAADALSLPTTTVMRWCTRAQAIPVVVRQEQAVEHSVVAVVTPTGWRIEGLSLEQAAALLGAR